MRGAYCPGTWGSDHDHHPAPSNDRIQKRMGYTLSEARPNSSSQTRKSSLPNATLSLKRRECSFREKYILACWSAQGRWSPATQTDGSAAWCVQSTRHGKNHHHCSAIPPARESSEERAQLVEFTPEQKSGAERWNRSTPKWKDEYAMHLLPTYTHAMISGSWMQ